MKVDTDLIQRPAFAATVLLGSVLYVPLLSELARMLLYWYLLGSWAKSSTIQEKDTSVLTTIVISFSLSTIILILTGSITSPNTFLARGVVAVIGAVLYFLSWIRRSQRDEVVLAKSGAIISMMILIPLIPIYVFNPNISYLADGWKHYSIYQLVSTHTIPPPHPWLHGTQFAYPYGFHVMLSAIFGQSSLAPHWVFIAGTVFVTLIMAWLVYVLARRYYDERAALWTVATYYLISTTGVIFFAADLMQFALRNDITPGFMTFLLEHSGPHVYYTAMHFLSDAGLHIIYSGSALLGTAQLLFIIGSLWFYLRKEYVALALTYGGLLTSNPVAAVILGLSLGFSAIVQKGKDLWYTAAAGFTALLMNIPYILSLISKEGVVGESMLAFPSTKGLWMFLLFIIGYAPLIILAISQARKQRYPRREVVLAASFLCANLIVALLLKLGYLYVSFVLFLLVALLAGPRFAGITTDRPVFATLKTAALLIGLGSTLLFTATYTYYTIDLDPSQMQAAYYLKEVSDSDDVVLEYFGTLSTQERTIHVYPSAIAGRQVYIADPKTLETYGDSYQYNLENYHAFFTNPSCDRIPEGVDFLYVPEGPPIELPCLQEIYDERGVQIYAINASGEEARNPQEQARPES